MSACVVILGEAIAGCPKIQRLDTNFRMVHTPILHSGAAVSPLASQQEGSSPWCHGHTLQELLRS